MVDIGYKIIEYIDALYILGMPPDHSFDHKPAECAGSGYRSKSACAHACALRAFRSIPHAHTIIYSF